MNITVTTRHHPVEDVAREYAEEKVGKVVRLFDRLGPAQVVIDRDKETYVLEASVGGPKGAAFQAKAESMDLRSAIDQLAKKLEVQVRQWKGKHIDHIHGNGDRSPEPRS